MINKIVQADKSKQESWLSDYQSSLPPIKVSRISNCPLLRELEWHKENSISFLTKQHMNRIPASPVTVWVYEVQLCSLNLSFLAGKTFICVDVQYLRQKNWPINRTTTTSPYCHCSPLISMGNGISTGLVSCWFSVYPAYKKAGYTQVVYVYTLGIISNNFFLC